MTSERICGRKGCRADISALRTDALYCSESCAKAARRAASADKARTRRKSRDGLGTRVYLTGEEINWLAAIPRERRHRGVAMAGRVMAKLDRALDRIAP